jgi:hypothetical protein
MLAQDRPPIIGYDQDAEKQQYSDAPVDEALDQFSAVGRTRLRLVAAASAADLARVGVHAARGNESVAQRSRESDIRLATAASGCLTDEPLTEIVQCGKAKAA